MTPDDAPSVHASRRLRLWVGYWLGLFVIMHVPIGSQGSTTVIPVDKVVHAVLYFTLVWLGGRYLLAKGGVSMFTVIAWALVYAAYAALDEWLQTFVQRTMSLGDWVSDIAGIVAATILVARHRTATISEPTEATK